MMLMKNEAVKIIAAEPELINKIENRYLFFFSEEKRVKMLFIAVGAVLLLAGAYFIANLKSEDNKKQK